MDIKLNVSKEKGITILEVQGDINAHTVNEFEKKLHQIVENNNYKILIDCKNLDYISSAGLGALMGVIETVKNNGGDIKLCNTSPSVYRVFDILGFTELFKIYPSLEEGLKAFEENG